MLLAGCEGGSRRYVSGETCRRRVLRAGPEGGSRRYVSRGGLPLTCRCVCRVFFPFSSILLWMVVARVCRALCLDFKV